MSFFTRRQTLERRIRDLEVKLGDLAHEVTQYRFYAAGAHAASHFTRGIGPTMRQFEAGQVLDALLYQLKLSPAVVPAREARVVVEEHDL